MSHFPNQVNGDVNIIFMPDNFSTGLVDEFKSLNKSWLLTPAIVQLMDFSKTIRITPSATHPLILFKNALKADQKYLFSMGLNSDLLKSIKAEGLDNVFLPVGSLTEAREKAGLRKDKKKMSVELINPVLGAAVKTLGLQANVEAKAGQPYLKAGQSAYDVGIAGVISLMSEQFHGSIVLCFPGSTFLGIYNSMFDEDNKVITREIEDAAGELLNIIYGQAKVELNDKMGHQLKMAIPKVLTAERLQIRSNGSSPIFVIPFESSAGPFHIEIETN